MTEDLDRLDVLAAIEHEQWMTWARSIMSADDVTIGPERLARWQSYMVPFDRLPEEAKEHDRVWARAVDEIAVRERDEARLAIDENREAYREQMEVVVRERDELREALLHVVMRRHEHSNGCDGCLNVQRLTRAALHREDGA